MSNLTKRANLYRRTYGRTDGPTVIIEKELLAMNRSCLWVTTFNPGQWRNKIDTQNYHFIRLLLLVEMFGLNLNNQSVTIY